MLPRLALAVLALSVPVLAQTPAPVRVYVTSAGAVNGFTDPSAENRDSVKEIERAITKRKKTLALAQGQEDAQIVLTVLGREKAPEKSGVFGTKNQDRIMRVTFACGTFSTDMTVTANDAFSTRPWGNVASQLAKQVEDWVNQNRDKIP